MCCKDDEYLDNLFLHRPVVLSLWHRLFLLRNVMWLAPKGSAQMLLIDFHAMGGLKRAKVVWSCAVFTTFWVLWLKRMRGCSKINLGN